MLRFFRQRLNSADTTPKSNEDAAHPESDGLPTQMVLPSSASLTESRQRRRADLSMFLRVGALAILAGLAAFAQHHGHNETTASDWRTWGALAIAYGLSILVAWWWDRRSAPSHAGWIQLSVDTILAAIVVQMSGGIESAFSFLYMISIVGAATHGRRRQTWASFGACALVYITMSILQVFEVVLPTIGPLETNDISLGAASLILTRNLGAMIAVTAFADTLNRQWQASETARLDLEVLHASIVHSLTSGLITLDLADRITFANPTAFEILDLAEDPYGRKISTLIPEFDCDWIQQQKGGRIELEFDSPLGIKRSLGLSAGPLRDAGQQLLGHVLHFQDVTELRRLEGELRRNERLAAVGQLAATVAHELRNPLAAVSGCAELLELSLGEDEERRLKAVILREVKRLDDTVQQLLDFTRAAPTVRTDTDLYELIHEVIEAFELDPERSELVFEIDATRPLLVHMDRKQITQALWNLLRNAAEAQENQGTIVVHAKIDRDDCILEVLDEGRGIDPADRSRILEPFYSTKVDGSGFGLAVVARIVENHRGHIEIEARPEGGTSFRLRWPCSQQSLQASSAA